MAFVRKLAGRAFSPTRRIARNIDAVDRSVFDAVASSRSPVMDRFMPKVSYAADYSVLWIGLGAAMAATKNQRLVWGA